MPYYCFKCQKELSLPSSTAVGRRDECPSCRSDMHVCKNCRHYDAKAYNECREPQAERVLEKMSANFCDYFDFRDASGPSGIKTTAQHKALKSLDDLFSK